MQKADLNDKKREPAGDKLKNLNKQDIVRANDFNFLTVLGKGSFGKVSVLSVLGCCEVYSSVNYIPAIL